MMLVKIARTLSSNLEVLATVALVIPLSCLPILTKLLLLNLLFHRLPITFTMVCLNFKRLQHLHRTPCHFKARLFLQYAKLGLWSNLPDTRVSTKILLDRNNF